MVERTKYAIPIDCLRRVDASVDQDSIGDNYSIPISPETVRAFIESVERSFERRAVELTDQSKSDELHEGIERTNGYTIYLEESNVKPLDTNEGDKVEIRTGRDSWQDVTDDAFLDPDEGVVELDRWIFVNRINGFLDQTNYRFRVSYRYGGEADEAGETETTGTVPDTETTPFTMSVADASEIEVGAIILVGGSEYMLVTDRDTGNDTLTIGERALRGTSATTVGSGDGVNFIPLDVRDAISAKVASRILRQDDFLDALNEGEGDSIDTQQKVEDLEEEFENVVSLYSTSGGYV